MATQVVQAIIRPVRDLATQYDLWCEPEFAERVSALPGINRITQACNKLYHVSFDPRYLPDSILADIEALGGTVDRG